MVLTIVIKKYRKLVKKNGILKIKSVIEEEAKL